MKYWKLTSEELRIGKSSNGQSVDGVISVRSLTDARTFVEKRYARRIIFSALYTLGLASTFGFAINIHNTYGVNVFSVFFYALTALLAVMAYKAWPGEMPNGIIDCNGHILDLDSGCTSLNGGIYLK